MPFDEKIKGRKKWNTQEKGTCLFYLWCFDFCLYFPGLSFFSVGTLPILPLHVGTHFATFWKWPLKGSTRKCPRSIMNAQMRGRFALRWTMSRIGGGPNRHQQPHYFLVEWTRGSSVYGMPNYAWLAAQLFSPPFQDLTNCIKGNAYSQTSIKSWDTHPKPLCHFGPLLPRIFNVALALWLL